MELRRALLLFAIVLGLAALVASLDGSFRDTSRSTTAPEPAVASPAAQPASAQTPTTVKFSGGRAPVTRFLNTGRAATVTVSVDEPGDVRLAGLGLTDSAEPRDPAQFNVLIAHPGHHDVFFTPAGGIRARLLGVLTARRRQ